ncbi:MAG TPA: helix-turn-helix transcriptional regulator [Terriglobales bacterium]|nr:helix-turn-helix transcriptional regulator [Terriglobales bacterium]
MANLVTPRRAAEILGISYPTAKQWIYRGKLRSVRTPGGHHRIALAELDRFLHRRGAKPGPERRNAFRRISGRNQLVGRVVEIKTDGLMAQVKLSIGGQVITSIITAGAVQEMGLKPGQTAAALIKSTEVMIVTV